MGFFRRKGSGFLKSTDLFNEKTVAEPCFLKQDLLTFMVYFYIDETYIGLKKFATLLPNNWLAETPQALAPRRLGRRSAERERISEIDWTF
ncbi:MAG: hypothetical protein ACQEW5_07365 [Bacillota bacterium]